MKEREIALRINNSNMAAVWCKRKICNLASLCNHESTKPDKETYIWTKETEKYTKKRSEKQWKHSETHSETY